MSAKSAVFFRQLAIALRSGLAAEQALALQARSASGALGKALAIALRHLRSGATLGDALKQANAAHPVFRASDLSLIQVGETSGKLAENLDGLATQLEMSRKLELDLLGRLAYPIGLLYIGFLVAPAGLLVTEGAGPYLAACLPKVVGLSLGLGLIVFGREHPAFGRLAHGFATLIPMVGGLLRKIDLFRFVTTTALAYRAGVDLAAAFRLAGEAVPDPRLKRAATYASVVIGQGREASVALDRYPELFPETFRQLYRTGEATGQIDDVLLKQADYWQDEIRAQQQVLARMAGLIALLVACGTVGAQVVGTAQKSLSIEGLR